jgi:hypothetical protein
LKRVACFGFALLILAGSFCACGDDERPSGSAPAPDGATSDGPVASSDGGRNPTPPRECEPPAQQGSVVDEVGVAGDPPPPLGGAIAPGTYVLTSMNAYVGPIPGGGANDGGEDPHGPGLTGRAGRGTLVITADVIRFIGSRGAANQSLPTDVHGAMFWKSVGTSIETTEACPDPRAKKAIPYSAVGSALALFVDPKHREIYDRR